MKGTKTMRVGWNYYVEICARVAICPPFFFCWSALFFLMCLRTIVTDALTKVLFLQMRDEVRTG